MYKAVILLALSVGSLVACTDSKQVKANNVLQVSDFDYTMNGKQATSVSFGETNKKFCSATIYRASVKSGYSVKSVKRSSKDLSMDCNWDGKYYVQSSKHSTAASLEIISLDLENKTATLSVSLKLVDPSADKYFSLKDVLLIIENQKFDSLLKKI